MISNFQTFDDANKKHIEDDKKFDCNLSHLNEPEKPTIEETTKNVEEFIKNHKQKYDNKGTAIWIKNKLEYLLNKLLSDEYTREKFQSDFDILERAKNYYWTIEKLQEELTDIIDFHQGEADHLLSTIRRLKENQTCCDFGEYTCQIPMPINGRVQYIDKCIAPIVAALNAANIITIASCCGHGKISGNIALRDGQYLSISTDGPKPKNQVGN